MTNTSKAKQGFASMDKNKQKEIASKGSVQEIDEQEDEDENELSSKGKQGFTSMDKGKQREIASKGGKSSHSGSGSNK
ncbi:KGG domain-containing protein [Chroococcus sp. FPU101]|uniref:KGG domain-containing protein n=1 Tax=Chroococcus sp. FPU101 TaxID=1974212 RepID=UPI001A8CCF94|nr:KGG domain-containing protein [Chroococcus sp. FPU101]GFE71774.1 hypothetical protein CFPU101_43840 [Chroococcus sp. FPU101]